MILYLTLRMSHRKQRQRHLQKLLNLKHWWKRWYTDYLINLRDTHSLQSSRKGKEFIRLKEGDVVCILEDKVPRGQWKLGKIETQNRKGYASSRRNCQNCYVDRQIVVYQ